MNLIASTNRSDSISVAIVDHPIDSAALLPLVADPDVGAHAWFYGVTRRTTNGRITQSLDYQAYRPMAISQLERLAEEAAAQFTLKRLIIVHRLGTVPIGQQSIVIGCSSAHRKDAFAALAWLMDRIKQQVPIWKRECFADGTLHWVHPSNQGTENESSDTTLRSNQ